MRRNRFNQRRLRIEDTFLEMLKRTSERDRGKRSWFFCELSLEHVFIEIWVTAFLL
jgi:hypothetical protein